MAKQYRVDTSEGMAEYIKSMNEEQLDKDTYYQNWQRWQKWQNWKEWFNGLSEQLYNVWSSSRGNKNPVTPGFTQVSRPSATDTAKYKDAGKMYQNRADFYKNLTTSATESVDTINKYWDATNLALKQKAGYDISQA